ncbi:EAL domain-containing protein [Sulfoacidibacillus thermotolerans]|uniref:EAL domain-containing protein n=1 Tax=Sulfoacidibacillus thermotolerans TaxID=1765684 RepID=A0A2U3D8A1_SULT2|nr:EAL domain-containing protein [Sulfoacidibacillus thermotolerans]PWI57479.1 hypothetical protein BM613_08375 [Sulfoacidibacillus thermotolerans]
MQKRWVSEVLKKKSLYTLYQPIVDHRRGQVIAHEALSRPYLNQRFFPPDIFFKSAARCNQQAAADRLAFEQAIAHFQYDSLSCKTLFINVIPTNLLDARFVHFLERIAGRFRQLSMELVIELVEYIPYCTKEIVSAIDRLRSQGVYFALDDLQEDADLPDLLDKVGRIHPEYVKIDKSMIQGLARSIQQQKQVERLLKVIPESTKIVAEGVEEWEDLHLLRELGVHLSQGFYWSKPLKMSETPWLLAQIELQKEGLHSMVMHRDRPFSDAQVVAMGKSLDLLLLSYHVFKGDL